MAKPEIRRRSFAFGKQRQEVMEFGAGLKLSIKKENEEGEEVSLRPAMGSSQTAEAGASTKTAVFMEMGPVCG